MTYENILVLCSCPDEAVARRIAHTLVDERLAACVNRLSALRSTYRWQGRIEDEPEVLLLIKAGSARFEALERRIRTLHPHEIPEIIALPIVAGSQAYLDWLAHETTPESATPADSSTVPY
ncbi:MAG: divalent-cation tolerance protein CutA [Gammaproteobacteria bacterium]|nr:divalent-cation tolerance protein CutA [Gammaproteobacteria bacterium]